MTDRERADQVADLLTRMDRLRLPASHRSVEDHLSEVDEIKRGLRSLHRDLAGFAAPPPRRPTRSEFPGVSCSGGQVAVQFRGRPRRVAIGG